MPRAGEELLRLKRLEVDRNVPGLIQALDSEAKDARLRAVWALGRLGDQRAIPHLIERMKDPDRLVRCCACEALGVLRAKGAQDVLLEALRDSDEWVRTAAAGALCRVGEVETIPRLRAALREAVDADPDREVRLSAAESLLVLGDKEVRERIPVLIKALPWRRRGASQVKRLKAAVELEQPLTPATYLWERLRPGQ